jgi:hypothetical protein
VEISDLQNKYLDLKPRRLFLQEHSFIKQLLAHVCPLKLHTQVPLQSSAIPVAANKIEASQCANRNSNMGFFFKYLQLILEAKLWMKVLLDMIYKGAKFQMFQHDNTDASLVSIYICNKQHKTSKSLPMINGCESHLLKFLYIDGSHAHPFLCRPVIL